MAAPVPVYVSTNYAAGPNQPIPVYVVNSDGGGSDSYTKTESDAKYTAKTAFYNYAGGDETHPPAAASATYTPANAFYAYAGGNAGAPPASAPSTYLKITDASSTYTTLVQTQALANALTDEIANSEDIANKTQTVDGNPDHYPSCTALNSKLTGYAQLTGATFTGNVSTQNFTANGKETIEYNGVNGDSALIIKGFGFGKGWACTMTPSGGNETDGTEYYRFMDKAGTLTRGVMIFRKQTTPAIDVVVYKGGLESQSNTNWVNDITTSITSPTHRQLATALAMKTYVDTADATKVNTSAIVTTIDNTVTNSQVPAALAMKNYVDTQVANIISEADIVTDFSGTLTNTQVPGAQAIRSYIDNLAIRPSMDQSVTAPTFNMNMSVVKDGKNFITGEIVICVGGAIMTGATSRPVLNLITMPYVYGYIVEIEFHGMSSTLFGSAIYPNRNRYYGYKATNSHTPGGSWQTGGDVTGNNNYPYPDMTITTPDGNNSWIYTPVIHAGSTTSGIYEFTVRVKYKVTNYVE